MFVSSQTGQYILYIRSPWSKYRTAYDLLHLVNNNEIKLHINELIR